MEEKMSKKLIKKFQTPLGLHMQKRGGKLIPKHAKGSPVNTNPLPKDQINDNPIPSKKEDKKKKKKLFEIDQRIVGLRPTPGLLTFPKGNGNGLYMIKRNE